MQFRRILLCLLTTLAFINEATSQKKINLKIVIDKNIDINLLSIHYDNGIRNESISKKNLKNYMHGDSIILNATNYAKKMAIEVYYYSPITKNTSNYTLFTNKEECFISLKEEKNKLVAKKITNAELIESPDSINNNFLRDIVKSKEYQTYIDAFNYPEQNPSNKDSLKYVRKQHRIKLNQKIITIAAKYKNDYFTFWYFRNKVAGLSLIIIPDEPNSIRELTTAFNTLFSTELLNSIEGNYTITKLQSLGRAAIKEGDTITDFQAKDFFGKEIQLHNTASKYTLLVFWATWCPPCLAELSNIRKINNDFKKKRTFRIIGISLDRNINEWRNYVTKENLNWDNIISDDNNKLADLFRINSIPQAYLLDSSQKVVKIFSGYSDSDINNHISKLDI